MVNDYSKLKTALGISTKSLVHHWNKAGAPSQILGYATHVEATSRAAKYMYAGGYKGGEELGEKLYEKTLP